MGREWYFNWGSKSSKKDNNAKGGRRGRGGGDRKSSLPKVATAAAVVAASGGCMNTVLHMFDFNHLNLCLHPNNNNNNNNNNGSYPQDDTIVPLKGVEAPRNSLESVKDEDDTTSVDVRIKTNRRDIGLKLVQAPRPKVEDTMSQSSCSPSSTSARTPTLVARLMGLDILPESTSTTPRSSSSYTRVATSSSTPPSTIRTPKSRTKDGGHSRPRTPNSSSMSSQRRKSTDTVDRHDSHRLSLQISNKESSIVKEMESSRPSCSAINTKRRDGRKYVCEEGNKSPGYYARQIMKQVKETVSRRAFGADITNTVTGSCSSEEVRRDEHLLSTTKQQQQQQPKKSRKEQSTASPKMVKSSETGKKCSERVLDLQQSVEKAQLKTVVMRESEKKTVDLMKKLDGTKQSSKIISIKNKKDEQFVRASTRSIVSSTVDKKCRKTPLSNIEHFVRPSTNKLPEIQEGSLKASHVPKLVNTTSTRLSRGPAQRTLEKPQEKEGNYPAFHEKKEGAFHEKKEGISTSSIVECQYISRILKCTGIDRDTPISFTRWFSTSHPLNPTIFHTLEATHYPATTNNNANNSIDRKLIFHLVDEILAEILKPYIKIKPISRHHNNPKQIIQINGFQLVKTLSTKIRSFPRANCKTLQDIDALVEKDLPKLGVVSDNLIAIDEEFEDIVSEIEGHIVDSLVQEIITMFCFDNGHMNRKRCTLYNGLIR